MIDALTLRRWLYWLLLAILVFTVVFVQILPLSHGTSRLPGPDLILCTIMAWTLRRPDYVPVLLVAALVFMTDMLFQRPPGLRAALVVLGLEFLRNRSSLSGERSFAMEWGLVAAAMAMIMLGERVVLGLFMVDQVSFASAVLRLFMSALFYPVVVVVSVHVLGVRRTLPGDADALRQSA